VDATNTSEVTRDRAENAQNPCITQAQSAHLTAAEAKNHVGETATVCGRVASAHFAEKTKGLPTFMNLDMPYPHQIFTIVIWGTDRTRFGNPERTYRDKNICVSGKITSHREIPEIVVTSPGQIQIQNKGLQRGVLATPIPEIATVIRPSTARSSERQLPATQ
jgi:hypothetical protein